MRIRFYPEETAVIRIDNGIEYANSQELPEKLLLVTQRQVENAG